MPIVPAYRVEHRQPHGTTVLAVLGEADLHHRALDPFVGWLLHEGRPGWVVLVDDATDAEVVRKRIERPPGARSPRPV